MYPFGDISRDQHRQLADKIYAIELAKDLNPLPVDSERSIAEEAVFVSIGFLIEKVGLKCSSFDFAGRDSILIKERAISVSY
jgi:hypothetical protein